MPHQRPVPRLTAITSLSLGALLALPAVAVAVAPAVRDGAPPVTPAHLRLVRHSYGLEDCPDLKYGHRDPVAGMDCVRTLQSALRAVGYDQAVSGYFGPLTRANVLDFQRRRGIRPLSGIAGPKTRGALLGGPSTGDPEPPPVSVSDYSSRYSCEGRTCSVLLRRTTTKKYARWLEAHPTSTAVAGSLVIEGACGTLKRARVKGLVQVVCGVVGALVAEGVADRLKEAARQGACLRLSIRFGLGRPLTAEPDNTSRCSD